MPRKKITDLLGSELANLQRVEETETPAPEQNQIQSDGQTDLQSSRLTEIETPKELEVSEVPKYLQLERKEVRLRLDQLDELTSLVRRLNRARKGKGERLTENTLIRVAIDLLLKNADQLQGFTEDELLASLGLAERD